MVAQLWRAQYMEILGSPSSFATSFRTLSTFEVQLCVEAYVSSGARSQSRPLIRPMASRHSGSILMLYGLPVFARLYSRRPSTMSSAVAWTRSSVFMPIRRKDTLKKSTYFLCHSGRSAVNRRLRFSADRSRLAVFSPWIG